MIFKKLDNLRRTRTAREAVELFWKQVTSKYEGVERTELGGLIFTVDEKPRIHHIGFAEHGSPAGLKFIEKIQYIIIYGKYNYVTYHITFYHNKQKRIRR